jgi:hypothetical protein
MVLLLSRKEEMLMKLWGGVFLGLVLIWAASENVLAWTTPVNISNTAGRSDWPSMAVDSWGHVHVVWHDDTSGNNEVLYCFYDGEAWSTPVNLSNDSTDSERADITVDANGHPHVAWKDHQSMEILWTFYDGVSWSSPANISNNAGYSPCPSLAADDSGRVFVAWHDIDIPTDNSDIYFSVYDGSLWSEPQNLTDDPEDSAYPDIAVDSKGHVHLVWMNYGADIEVYYSEYDGSLWSSWVNISNLVGYSVDPKIALDSQDHPHVVWEERKWGYHVYYTFYDGQEWAVSEKLSEGEENYGPTIALDSRDRVYTMWSKKIDQEMELHWSFYDTTWSDITVVPSTPGRSAGPQIAVDVRDSLYVTFSGDAEENRDIFYTRRSPTGVREQPEEGFPLRYNLEQNYPNPFNPCTEIRYSLTGNEPAQVTLKVYNLLGNEVVTLVEERQTPGEYEVSWDGCDDKGGDVCSGVYFYQLRAGGSVATRKMVLLR